MVAFADAARLEGVCIEYSETISRLDTREKVTRVVSVIRDGTARVLVAFLAQGEMDILIEEAVRQKLTGLQWVGSESWITAGHLATKRNTAILTGSLGFTIRKSTISGLKEFLLRVNPSQNSESNILKEFWEAIFDCNFDSDLENKAYDRQCSGSEKLANVSNPYTDVSELRISNNVYKAVYAVAHTMHNMFKCKMAGGNLNQSCAWTNSSEREQVR